MRRELEEGLSYIRERLNWEGPFDPLNDSAHALKLMALLHIELRYDWYKSTELVITRPSPLNSSDPGGWCTAEYADDPEAAMRESITSSAACYGRDQLSKLRPVLPVPTKAKRPSQIPVGTLLPIDDVIHTWNGSEWEPLTLNDN